MLEESRKSDIITYAENGITGGITVAVCYEKLFIKLNEKKLSSAELTKKAGFSGNIMTRIRRNEYVSLESIEKICGVLNCKMDDVVSFRSAR